MSNRGEDEFLDDVLDAVTSALADGQPIDVATLSAPFPHLAGKVAEIVRLATDVSVVAPTDLPAIPGYEIVRELGQGGMGTVFLARQSSLGDRLVALKVLPHHAGLSERARARFHNEALALARIRHANVVEIYDVSTARGLPAYAMEWIDGSSLLELIEATRDVATSQRAAAVSRQLDQAEVRVDYFALVARWGADIASALTEVHRAGLLHRDVKPSNILLRRDGTPLLADFGVARDEGASLRTNTGAFLGTPSYAAPEQLRGAAIDARTDVYGLGATLYHATTGRVPFAAKTDAEILRRIDAGSARAPRRLEPQLPRDLATIVETAMEATPQRRYASCEAMREDLERFLSGQPIRARPASLIQRIDKSMRRNKSGVFGAIVGGVLVSVLAIALALHFLARAKIPERVAEKLRQARITLLDPHFDERLQWILVHRGSADRRRGQTIDVTSFSKAIGYYDEALALREAPEVRAVRDTIAAARAVLSNNPMQLSTLERDAPVTAGVARGWIDMPETLTIPTIPANASSLDRRCLGLLAMLCAVDELCIAAWRDLDLARKPDPLVDASLGQLYWQRGESALAWPRLERAFAHFHDVGFLGVRLADAALACGDAAYALRTIEHARTLSRFDGYGTRFRVHGAALFRLGRQEDATREYARLASHEAISPMNHASLAEFFDAVGQHRRAVHHRWRLAIRWPYYENAASDLGHSLELAWSAIDLESRRSRLRSSLDAPGTLLDQIAHWFRNTRERSRCQQLDALARAMVEPANGLRHYRQLEPAAKDRLATAWSQRPPRTVPELAPPGQSQGDHAEPTAAISPVRFELVSRAFSGGMPNGPCDEPAISADARYVAFVSHATNLVAEDSNSESDVFVRDRVRGTTQRITNAVDGSGSNGPSRGVAISTDGRFVAFYSRASNLVSRDGNEDWDCFVFDREQQKLTCLSVDGRGIPLGTGSPVTSASLTHDARYVLFHRAETAGERALLCERDSGRVVWTSPESTAITRTSGVVAANGKKVYLASQQRLVEPDTNGWVMDVFAADVATGEFTRISEVDGRQVDFSMPIGSATCCGRWLGLYSKATSLMTIDNTGATNLFLFDCQSRSLRRIAPSSGVELRTAERIAVSLRTTAYVGRSGDIAHIYAFDHATARTRLVTQVSGKTGDASSGAPAISADGRTIAFRTAATNLGVPGGNTERIVVAILE